jgi:hypothetical protein
MSSRLRDDVLFLVKRRVSIVWSLNEFIVNMSKLEMMIDLSVITWDDAFESIEFVIVSELTVMIVVDVDARVIRSDRKIRDCMNFSYFCTSFNAFWSSSRFLHSSCSSSYLFHRTRYFISRRAVVLRLINDSISNDFTMTVSFFMCTNSDFVERDLLYEFELRFDIDSSWATNTTRCIFQWERKFRR